MSVISSVLTMLIGSSQAGMCDQIISTQLAYSAD